MNAVRVAPGRERTARTLALALPFGAVWFLLSRSAIGTLGSPALAIGYIALGVTSATVVGRATAARAADPWFPLALGTAAVLIARLAAGPAPPLPTGLAVVALNTAAAVAEEAFFRGFLFGRLERWSPGAAVVGSALAFAAIHVPLYGWTAFPVDLGAGLLFSWQRAASGRWSVPAATHAFANLLAVLR